MEAKELLEQFTGLLTKQAEQFNKNLEDFKKQNLVDPLDKEKLNKMAEDTANVVTKFQAMDERLKSIEEASKKMAREAAPSDETIGALLTKSADYPAFVKNPRNRLRVELPHSVIKAIVNPAALAQRVTDRNILVARGAELMFGQVRSLLGSGTMTSTAYTFVRETSFTNNAGAQVGEGSPKGLSDIAYSQVTVNASTIAHYMKASRQSLDDVAAFSSEIDARGFYGLGLIEESHLLNGTGTNGQITGLLSGATPYNTSLSVSGDTRIDRIRRAILQVTLAGYMPQGVLLHPTDWAQMETLKSVAGDGGYFIGNPHGAAMKRLWGLPVAETLQIATSTWLVGPFRTGAMILDRQEAAAEIATENEDDFIKNMVTIRVEERIAFPIFQPAAFVTGNYS